MAKYEDKMLKYMPHSSLDTWTFNKSICKMRESLRVSEKAKEKTKKLRR